MASQLGCDDSKPFTAVAPVSGLRFPLLARWRARCRSCPSTGPPTRSIPTGATARNTGPTACPWRRCAGRPPTAASPSPARRSRPRPSSSRPPRGCKGGAEVELYTLTGEGQSAGQAACPEGGHRAARAAVGRGQRRHRDVEVLLPPRARLRPDRRTPNSRGHAAHRDKRPAGACARAAQGLRNGERARPGGDTRPTFRSPAEGVGRVRLEIPGVAPQTGRRAARDVAAGIRGAKGPDAMLSAIVGPTRQSGPTARRPMPATVAAFLVGVLVSPLLAGVLAAGTAPRRLGRRRFRSRRWRRRRRAAQHPPPREGPPRRRRRPRPQRRRRPLRPRRPRRHRRRRPRPPRRPRRPPRRPRRRR